MTSEFLEPQQYYSVTIEYLCPLPHQLDKSLSIFVLDSTLIFTLNKFQFQFSYTLIENRLSVTPINVTLICFNRVLRECVVQQLTNVEKLVSGKMSKQQYMDADNPLHRKKEDALEKIKALLTSI